MYRLPEMDQQYGSAYMANVSTLASCPSERHCGRIGPLPPRIAEQLASGPRENLLVALRPYSIKQRRAHCNVVSGAALKVDPVLCKSYRVTHVAKHNQTV